MRIIKLICVITIVAIICVGCGEKKSEAAKNVINKIDGLEKIDIDNENSVMVAESAYEELSEEEKKQVDNYEQLVEARNTIDSMKEERENEALANEIDESINKIVVVTLSKEKQINDARNKYNNANPQVQKKVEKLSVLEEAENKYIEIFNEHKEEVEKAAKKIDNKINKIKKVKLSSGEKIKNIREEYDHSSQEVKDLVTKYKKFEKIEKEFNDLVFDNALNYLNTYFTKKYDDVEDRWWYEAKTMPKYANLKTYVLPYFGRSGNDAYMVIRYNFTSSDWIFFTNIIIATDNNRYKKEYNSWEIDREVGGGTIVESMDDTDTKKKDLEMIYDMATSNKTVVRFQGDNYYYDLVLTESDKDIFLAAYYANEYFELNSKKDNPKW